MLWEACLREVRLAHLKVHGYCILSSVDSALAALSSNSNTNDLNQETMVLADYTHKTESEKKSRSALNKNTQSWTMVVSGTVDGTELYTIPSWELTADFGPITYWP